MPKLRNGSNMGREFEPEPLLASQALYRGATALHYYTTLINESRPVITHPIMR